MLILIISLLAGISIALAAHGVSRYLEGWGLEKRLKGTLDNAVEIQQRGLTGNLFFLASKIGELLKGCRLKYFIDSMEKLSNSLAILGEPFSRFDPYTIAGVQVLCAAGAALIAVILLGMNNVVLLLATGAVAFLLPPAYLRQQVKDKHGKIFRQIPDFLDLLCLMVDAGLDFNSALNRILASEEGVLVQEFFLAQQEVKLGKARAEAYSGMAERLKYPPLNTLVNSLNLALKTGGSITPTLKALSAQFRVERFQLAEKAAAEAPLKLMAPLVLLIFPTIFIILFGPILLSFMGK
ncbi:MAG: type II secretion system F family protein [Endomicrobiales bacterium]